MGWKILLVDVDVAHLVRWMAWMLRELEVVGINYLCIIDLKI